MTTRIDKLGIAIALLVALGIASPFATVRANRIVQGEAVGLLSALPAWAAGAILALATLAALSGLLVTRTSMRLPMAVMAIVAIFLGIGLAGQFLEPDGNSYARISPASGFWILFLALALLAIDAIARSSPRPVVRLLYLVATAATLMVVLLSGVWNDLSIMKEYAARADVFWTEMTRHLLLALGSLAAATVVGLPVGVFCERTPAVRSAMLNTLNLIQTIPSIALFGILIGPLGWIAANVPGASAVGIRGIGAAPAFVALFLYSLLPVVANTVAGLDGVPRVTREAARGLGMTSAQRLFRIDLPLALPVILTAVRIVLVQNIGLATVAALIGGGGLGTFVFQGLGQTATDLVLLGALPTVMLAFASAVVFDALSEMTASRTQGGRT
ncbi:putative osmoprotectant uptake system permease protein yehY [Pseudorhizobium banfieldiae]|uniref:Putative osmoprotectant uptake system permease protein yehY n=1 Tax=Pseudorhizobium banfieldiae TaxID=1125847 RepID=L0NFA6_9HYPH|nr:ABC transporter permease [arsenite-oxidising bacterium NT-25]CCF19501.1 putative osmoprotectant uptake system permease protein yehY [Pseudorhizobium banfieldiae]